MALPQRQDQNVYDNEDDSGLSAVQRAEKRWGTNPQESDNDTAPTDDLNTAENATKKPALERAQERWGMKPESDEKQNDSKTDNEDSFFKDEDNQSKQSKFSGLATRKNGIRGIIAAALVTGGFAGFTIISGPLQFIHIAQLLQRFHFSTIEETGDSRMLKLYKYAKNLGSGSVENTRLSRIGVGVAKAIDIRLSEIGVEKKFGKNFSGTYEGITIDPVKFAEKSQGGERFRGLNNEEFKAKFKEIRGVELIDGPNGKLGLTSEEIGGFFKNRSLNAFLAEESGYGKVAGAVATRTMGKRDGVTWRPIRRLDAKIVGSFDKRFTAWLKEMKARIKKGNYVDLTATATGEDASNPDNPDDATNKAKTTENARGADATNEAFADAGKGVKEAEDAGKAIAAEEGGIIKGITQTKAGKLTLGAAAVVGLVCAAKSISDTADGLKHDLVILPLIRTAMQAISLGNQIMSGQGIDNEQLNFFATQFNHPKSGSWAAAKSIQAEQGQPQTGPDIPDGASIKKLHEGTMFSKIINAIPFVGVTCKAASSSTIGKAFLTVVSLTTPFATLGTTLLLQTSYIKDALNSLVRWMAGSPIPTYVVGPDYGNYINIGARLAANNSMVAMGGKKLTKQETAEIRNYRLAAEREDLNKRSVAQKYFDVRSPDSVASKIIDGHSSSVTNNMASLFNSILSPSKFFQPMFSLFSKRVLAESNTGYDYGFDQIGFSTSELNAKDYDDPYKNANDVMGILSGGEQSDKYIKRAQDCFGVTLSADGNVTTDLSAKIDVLKKGDDSYDNNNCADSTPSWTKIRFYILDTKAAEALDCFVSSDSTSCTDSGFGSSGGGSNQTPSAVVSGNLPAAPGTCAAGTTKATGPNADGTFDGYVSGVKTPITLCSVDSLPVQAIDSDGYESTPGKEYFIPSSNGKALVESSKSADLANMVAKAIADKTPLTAISSFRTNEHQTKACGTVTNGKCANSGYALPGASRHQSGKAIDFLDSNRNSTANCRKPGRTVNGICQGTDDAWKWLNANAKQFNFFQLAGESWHWSADGN